MNRLLTGAIFAGVVATASVGLPQPAQAVQLVYDFTSLYSGNTQNGESFELTVDGLTVEITATRVHTNTGNTQTPNVTIRQDGVGVAGSGGPGIGHQGNWVETLRLSFQGQSVHLLSVTFGSTKDNSSFTLNPWNGSEIIQAKTREQMDTPNPEFDFEQAGIVIDQRTGKIFDFSVPALGTDEDYFLRALRVQVVPTPGAVLPGLIGLGTAAIRKKRQASEVEDQDASDSV